MTSDILFFFKIFKISLTFRLTYGLFCGLSYMKMNLKLISTYNYRWKKINNFYCFEVFVSTTFQKNYTLQILLVCKLKLHLLILHLK